MPNQIERSPPVTANIGRSSSLQQIPSSFPGRRVLAGSLLPLPLPSKHWRVGTLPSHYPSGACWLEASSTRQRPASQSTLWWGSTQPPATEQVGLGSTPPRLPAKAKQGTQPRRPNPKDLRTACRRLPKSKHNRKVQMWRLQATRNLPRQLPPPDVQGRPLVEPAGKLHRLEHANDIPDFGNIFLVAQPSWRGRALPSLLGSANFTSSGFSEAVSGHAHLHGSSASL